MLTFSNSVKHWIKQPFRKFMQGYLARSIPRQSTIQLTHKKLFILPTKAGWVFFISALLIWMLGTNYENNLALAFAFLLLALFLITILHTFNNIYNLQLKYISSKAVFVDDSTEVQISLLGDHKKRESLSLGWPENAQSLISIEPNQTATISATVFALQRGNYRPPRLLVQSTYPLGLWRCWSHIDLDVTILTYPKPIAIDLHIYFSKQEGEGKGKTQRGDENFDALHEYQIGDSLKHIAWKNYAQGRGLHTKKYASYQSQKIWLDWNALPGFDIEGRLARLTYMAIMSERNNDLYGLRLPNYQLPPDQGSAHLAKVLSKLALYQSNVNPMHTADP